jgi:hypothetical protein
VLLEDKIVGIESPYVSAVHAEFLVPVTTAMARSIAAMAMRFSTISTTLAQLSELFGVTEFVFSDIGHERQEAQRLGRVFFRILTRSRFRSSERSCQ